MPVREPDRVLLGLIGTGIQASRSPELHEAAGAALGRRLFYQLLDAQVLGFAATDLPRILDAVRWAGFAGVNVPPSLSGVNVPHPFKEAALPLLDEVDPTAARIGAVNTLTRRDRRLCGYDTDATGFVLAWRETLARLPGTVVLLGAGGVGRAIGHGGAQSRVHRDDRRSAVHSSGRGGVPAVHRRAA